MFVAVFAVGAAWGGDVVVHASVASVEFCTEPDDSQAWMYVTLDTHGVLSGALETEDGFVVRQRGGVYSDGTVGGLDGTPALLVGDEIIAALHFDDDGTQYDLTLRDEDVLFVVYPPFQVEPLLVDGTGRLTMAFGGGVFRGARVPDLDRCPTDDDAQPGARRRPPPADGRPWPTGLARSLGAWLAARILAGSAAVRVARSRVDEHVAHPPARSEHPRRPRDHGPADDRVRTAMLSLDQPGALLRS